MVKQLRARWMRVLALTTILLAIPPPKVSASTSFDGRLTLGHSHGCVLRSDNRVSCWGRFDSGQTVSPAGEFRYVSAGAFHTCALDLGGTPVCWGHNQWGQTDTAPLTGRYQYVSGGPFHNCALTEDTFPLVVCWGRNDHGEASPPYPGLSLSGVSASGFSTCGIQVGAEIPGGGPVYVGPLICWGVSEGTESLPSSANHYSGLSGSADFGCAWKSYVPQGEDNVQCWGVPHVSGPGGPSNAPPGNFTEVGVGDFHVCGIRANGTLHCWGDNSFGQASPPAGSNFVAVASGNRFSCARRRDDSLVCWGLNYDHNVPRYAITPELLPSGVVGVPYGGTLSMSELTSNGEQVGLAGQGQSFRVSSGALPPGLRLNDLPTGTGVFFSGTPNVAGTFMFVLTARERSGFEASRSYTIGIESRRITGGNLPPRLLVPNQGAGVRGLSHAVSPRVHNDVDRAVAPGCRACRILVKYWRTVASTLARLVGDTEPKRSESTSSESGSDLELARRHAAPQSTRRTNSSTGRPEEIKNADYE